MLSTNSDCDKFLIIIQDRFGDVTCDNTSNIEELGRIIDDFNKMYSIVKTQTRILGPMA